MTKEPEARSEPELEPKPEPKPERDVWREGLEVAMAEFKALRDEINQRATYCHTLLNINVVASGTVAGLALNNRDRILLLLILPVLNPVLGLLWLDHSFAIRGMGDYVERSLRPLVNQYAGASGQLLGWEGHLDEHEGDSKVLRFIPLGAPIAVLFAGVPVASLALTLTSLGQIHAWLLWGLGLALTLAFIWMWARLLFKPYASARSSAVPTPRTEA